MTDSREFKDNVAEQPAGEKELIYCVEDDDSVRDIELYTLRSVGFEAEGFACGEDFFSALDTSVRLPALVILDVMLPGEDGVSVLRRLKSGEDGRADIPVIMATAKGTEYDKISGLDLGADDYLVKPFGMMEMVARVKAVLRRSRKASAAASVKPDADAAKAQESVGDILRLGQIELDLRRHTVSAGGIGVELTLKEFDMLRLFMKHPGMVFTRDRLLSDVWDIDYGGETRTVDVHIRTLRSKLGKCGEMIHTVRGVGYRMEENGD